MRRLTMMAACSLLATGLSARSGQAETLDDFLGLWEASDRACLWIQEVVETEAAYLSIERDMIDSDDYNCFPVTLDVAGNRLLASGECQDRTGAVKKTRLDFVLSEGVLADKGGRAFKRCYDEPAYQAKTCETELESISGQIDGEAGFWMEAVEDGDPVTACDRHRTYLDAIENGQSWLAELRCDRYIKSEMAELQEMSAQHDGIHAEICRPGEEKQFE